VNSYELMLIFDPNLGEETISGIVTKLEEKAKKLGAELEKTDKWGTRKLASVMNKARKLTQGYYVVIYFKAETSVPGQLQNTLKVTENIVRYSIMRATERPAAEIEGEPQIEAVNVGEIKEPSPAQGETGGQS